MHSDSPVVVRVVERDGDLDLMIDDGGGAPRVAYLGSKFTRQELTLVERWRRMPGERRIAFLALSQLLAAMREFAGAREDEPLDFIARKAFRDAARALDGEA